jgi:hypothetical protein
MASAIANAEIDVAFVRPYVRPMLAIVDACDTLEAVKRLNPRQIIPAQFRLSPQNQAKLDTGEPSQESAWSCDRADLATAFGILESCPDPPALLLALHAQRLPVLCSICARAEGGDSGESTLSSFEALCIDAGYSVVWRYLNGNDALYLLTPAGRDASGVTSVGYRNPSDTVTVLQPKRPALLVAGFFGRSNCGDEAIFQVIYEQLSSQFEIIVSLDEHGATEGYWNLYPYDRCPRIHQGNLADPARSCVGMIVGGGGLPLGFVADQILAGRSAGIPIALAGTDFPTSRIHADKSAERAIREYLGFFDFIALRSAAAVEQACRVGQPVVHGADWALRLATDENEEVRHVANRALIVLREFPLSAVQFHYVGEITRLVETLRYLGLVPTLLPFCAEDDRFANSLGLDLTAPTERHWWNARRVKQLIASSGLIISVGRLHPMILAASTRTPVVQLCPPLAAGIDPRSFTKIAAMADEFDVDYLPTVENLTDHLKRELQRPSGAEALTAVQARLAGMTTQLRSLFAQRLHP